MLAPAAALQGHPASSGARGTPPTRHLDRRRSRPSLTRPSRGTPRGARQPCARETAAAAAQPVARRGRRARPGSRRRGRRAGTARHATGLPIGDAPRSHRACRTTSRTRGGPAGSRRAHRDPPRQQRSSLQRCPRCSRFAPQAEGADVYPWGGVSLVEPAGPRGLSWRPSSVISHARPRLRSSVSYTDSSPIDLETVVAVTVASISGRTIR